MTLYCDTFSQLTKQPTLFIHGNLASAAWWKPTVEAWTKAGSLGAHPLYCADVRGCGHNPDWPNQSPIQIEDLAADFLELLNAKGLNGEQEVALVGHSLGGLIALQMMLLEPKRFCKAVLLDPVGAHGVVFDEAMYNAFLEMAKSRELTSSVILSFVKDPASLGNKLIAQIEEDAFKAVRGIGWSVLQGLRTVDIRDQLPSVNVPTLVLHGELDQIIPLHDSKELANLMPNAHLEILQQTGHCWNLENPGAFTQRLRRWFHP